MARPKIKEEVDIEKKEAYISRELGAVLIDYETGKYYETNDTGTFIVTLLRNARIKTVDQMIDMICEEYEVDRDIALQDFNEFVEKLEKYGLIEE
ncbi:MAG TPA: PqqD family protein [Candidatus Deferrimicrobium sp.]|nr:PqqD family protein [Candidatus Deferrimicrobium sp.]